MAGLALRGVGKAFGAVRAVEDVSIEVGDGELLVVVGPSGCGKSTTLRIVAGLESPDTGSVWIAGRDATRLPPAERDVAMVFQSHALFPHMTVRQNLAFGPVARHQAAGTVRARVAAVAETLGIEPLLDRRPAELSGGERQRVAVGRAMLRDPAVFLLDEPLSNLDAPLRAQMRTEIVRLQQRLGTTMVHVTHDQTEALGMGHRVGVMHDGALQQLGTPHEVYARPANLFVATFVGSPRMNVIPVRRGTRALAWAGGSVPEPTGIPDGAADLVLGVRPEHVHVRGSRWSERAQPGEAFRARVDLVESVGDQTFLTLDAAGEAVVARVEPSFEPARNEVVEAWFDPARLHVFDPASGRAVARTGEPA